MCPARSGARGVPGYEPLSESARSGMSAREKTLGSPAGGAEHHQIYLSPNVRKTLETTPRNPADNANQDDFSTRKFPNTRLSMSLLEKVLKALAGVVTMGSPRRLKDVFSKTGTPVALPKRSIN